MHDIAPWNGFAQAVTVIELFIEGYCLYRLVKPFLQRTKNALAAGGTYFVTMAGLYFMPPHIGIFTAYAVGSLAAFLVMCGTERRNYPQKAFLAATYYSLRWFASTVTDILDDYLCDLVEDTGWYQRNSPMSVQLLHFGGWLFYFIMLLAVTVGGTYCITKSYVYKYEQMSKRELFMLAIPPFLGVVGYRIIRYYRTFYILESGGLPRMYDLLLFFYCWVALTVVVIMIALFQNIKVAQREKLEDQMLAVQIDNLKRHIGQVENIYQDMRSIKHDMTNHILTLERLYAGSEKEQAQEYAKELKAALSNFAVGNIKSGNPVTDTILQEWKTEAEKRDIRFESDFHFPTDSDINAFDISVILNNALQNAVENTEGGANTHISIKSYRRNNAYMIEISNSFMGILQWDAECGLPITSKSNTDGHGYGLNNVRKVANKYFGDIDIVLKDEKFLLSIMLMME